MNNFAFSPFIVPVAGCLVAIVAIVAGIWLAVMIPALGVIGMHMAERFL